jgi:hypothetical protein
MTDAPESCPGVKMQAQTAPIDILFVIAPHSLLLDIAGPAEAFRLVNTRHAEHGQGAQFRLRFAGPVTSITTSVGLPIAQLEPLPAAFATTTWVVLVGQPSVHRTGWAGCCGRIWKPPTPRTVCSQSVRVRCWRRARDC